MYSERRQELTTEGGLDVRANEQAVGAAVERLRGAGIEVSIFVDPDLIQIELCKALGAKAVFVGRPVLWGLALGGADGVRAVLDELRTELDTAMALAGCATLKDIESSLVLRAG